MVRVFSADRPMPVYCVFHRLSTVQGSDVTPFHGVFETEGAAMDACEAGGAGYFWAKIPMGQFLPEREIEAEGGSPTCRPSSGSDDFVRALFNRHYSAPKPEACGASADAGGLPCPKCGSGATEHTPKTVMSDLYQCRDCGHAWEFSIMAAISAPVARQASPGTEAARG